MNEDIKKEENIDGPAPAAEEQPAAETAAEQASEPTEQASAAEPEEKEAGKLKKLKTENKRLKADLDVAQKAAAAAETTAAEAADRYARVCAEYENFRRRSVKEKEDTYAAATADALEALLPLLDNLSRAASYGEGEKVIEGVHMILGSLPDVLAKMNVTAYGQPGDTFDPAIHNAVMQVQNPDLPEGTVADVLQCGYRYGDKIIRHAMVSVVC